MRNFLLIGFFCLLHVSVAWAQDRTIRGRVTSADDGTGLPGVNVLLKGTGTGVVTDADGNYSLTVPAGPGTLVFSFIGLRSEEIEIGERSVIDMPMQEDVAQLGEVVVTALGISREKRSVGYSIANVSGKDLTKGTSSNFTSALSGKIAGVQVTGGTGAPGSSTNVVLRGYANIGRGTQPLYVIDGVPVTNTNQNFNTNGADINRTVDFGNGINDINANDIESMSVLRGSAATAMYGSAGANGVIMITTKKGSKELAGKPRVSISSSVVFSSLLKKPSYQKDFGQGWDGHYASNENGNWGPRYTNDPRLWGNAVNGSQLYKDFSFLDDQLTDFYEVGTMFDNSVSVSSGNADGSFYISYNNVSSDGIVPSDKDSFNKNSFKFGASRKMGKVLELNASFNYINKVINALPTGQGQGGSANLFDDLLQHPADISLADMKNYKDPNSFFNPNNYFTPFLWNPYFTIDNTSNEANIDRMIASFTLNADIYKPHNIKGTLRFGGDVQNTVGHNYDGKYTLNDNSVNKGTQDDIDGYYREFQRTNRLYNLDAFVSGGHNFNNVNLNLLLGTNLEHNTQTLSMDEVKSLVLEQQFPNLANTSATPIVSGGFPHRTFRRQSLYSVLEASYKDVLYVTGALRKTWSSTLPQGNNSYFYPSINASLVLSDAFKALNTSWVDFIKVRVGYGQTGNDADPYVVNPVYVQGQVTTGIPFSDLTFPLGGVTGYEYSNVLGNPNLKPEISTDFETGLDFNLFDNRLGVDVTYYNKTTEGLLLQRTLASSSGFDFMWDNVGKMTNKGIEITASITPIRTSTGLTWDIAYKFDKNVNNVVSLTEGLDEVTITGFVSPSVVAIKGKTVSHVKAFGTQKTEDGRVIVDSQTGRPLATAEGIDLGSTLYDYTMGISNTITYKNFSLFFQFDYRHGGRFISYSKQSMMWSGKDPLTTYNDRKPFVVPNSVYVNDDGDYVENTIPITTSDLNNYYGGEWNDEANVLTKTFCKLRELNLTYNLPQSLLSKSFLSSASVSLVGNNLWLWTPSENNVIDPEITTAANGSGTEFGEIRGYPSVRNYGFRVNLSF
ncbi:SusC/RagA family TonB-linked outer membrane protein [Pseudochryseolinea flava]|uniref:SusC/RagA family TonB-linked outer membrane protein n=1 Tax=Pseudochryseolinea flava TaxID=2059302 RepID=A0A364Y4Q3_9BACT|nr:SusC/RagA family TonB-linked outer membrane protein [Pseudochryseolinea flava]RAW01867.1 SusC/RagA family TonB-linked outer membrane protein [Pseudochryseolinea flava]